MKCIVTIFIMLWLPGCFGRTVVKTGLEGEPMVSFNMLLMDSTTQLNTENIPPGKPIVLLFISPYCPYCRAQTEEIVSNIGLFTNIHLYILTNLPFPSIKAYADQYNLSQYKNITVGYNYDSRFVDYFKVPGIPYIAIYNKDKILKEVLIGEVDVNLIRDVALH